MQYDKTFKEEAVRLSDEIGPKKAAEQLGIPYHTLSYWCRTKSRYGQQAFPGSGKARCYSSKFLPDCYRRCLSGNYRI